jgi:hypothetical protein
MIYTIENIKLPINNLIKLNFEYFIKYSLKELKNIGKSLCETKVNKKMKKDDLCIMILNNKNLILKTEKELDEINNNIKIEYYKTLKERLYKNAINVENKNYETPCLVFKSVNNNINITIDKKVIVISKHVASYIIYKNIFIENLLRINENLEVLEICHGHGCSKNCIEPTHLSLKTKYENNYEDKIRDVTINRGENNYNSKITESIALQIKQSKGNGKTLKERSEYFGVNKTLIKSIDSNHSWFYLPDKDGNVCNKTSRNTMKDKETYKNNKNREFTNEEWDEALKKLRNKSIDSEEIVNNKNINTKCWLYQGSKDKDGYGKMKFKCVFYRCHILAIESFNRKKRNNTKLVVRHLCNIKNCCNPEHLRLGTYSENSIDAINNGHKCAKLNEKKVKEIRKLLEEKKLTLSEIAKKYNVKQNSISRIKNNCTWKHI